MISEAIILAGGLGTRLRTAVPDLPKSMAPVNNEPFLSYLIDYYSKQHIKHFIFSLGYMHDTVETFLKKKFGEDLNSSGLSYSVSVEPEPLGTGGAVLQSCQLATSKNVLIVNGDTFFAVNVAVLSDFHDQHEADCTLCLKPMTDSDRYGVVEIGDDHRIISFREKEWYDDSLINGGVYALNARQFLAEQLPEKFSFEKEYLENFCSMRKIFGFIQDRYFIDIGIPDDYNRAQKELKIYI